MRNLRTLPGLEVYISFYKKHIRPHIENVVSYMQVTTVSSGRLSEYAISERKDEIWCEKV